MWCRYGIFLLRKSFFICKRNCNEHDWCREKFFIKIEKKFSQLESESQKTVYHNKVFPIMFVAQLWSALFQEKPKHDSRFQGKFTEKINQSKRYYRRQIYIFHDYRHAGLNSDKFLTTLCLPLSAIVWPCRVVMLVKPERRSSRKTSFSNYYNFLIQNLRI